MSYILDALKKADAERERGTVPGLHSQPLGQIEDDDAGGRKAVAPAVWLGAGVGLCLIAVLSWQLLMREPAPQAAAPMPVPEMATAPVSPVPPNLTGNAVPYPPPPAPPSTEPEVVARVPVAQPVREPATPPPQVPAPAAAPAPTPARTTSNASATATAPQANARVPSINELPEDVRRDLPQLVIGGAMYSETPSSRMLIINSQVFHEGDQPYQGLLLEEIRLKSAVFKYRGYRYAINY
ncbi:MAG: general secretion pathway protein GspB [Aquabacterium sp.]|uniref:general secretion pathway protein GspB n=1 Tax=Aquabacterium sp. TaxID=1872578 RepID=UPI0025C66BFF|nr:general secretion pathway protein GspB [Aquabacterium sp.]MBI5927213.1 general secretion pathway protein GspB [Aquabacterium sp.]